MNFPARAPLLFLAVLLLAGCSQLAPEKQIRERIAAMGDAIRAERAEGILEFATPDWLFDASDGRTYDRAAHLERTKQLFAGNEIEALHTRLDRFDRHDARMEVWLTQTMVREETDREGNRTRWRLVYRERQDWVETRSRGWLVARVVLLHTPERTKLLAP